jgi:hypothetical protein
VTPNSFDLTPGLDAYSHLWMAVLRQAIDDAAMSAAAPEAAIERAHARRWLRADGSEPGTLQWICDVLNLRIDLIRSEFTRRCRRGNIQQRRRVVRHAATRSEQ